MAVQIQTRRSSTANDRPFPTRLGAGELALNNHSTSPGLFFADNVASPSTGLIKVGPVHIGSTAPNSFCSWIYIIKQRRDLVRYCQYSYI